MAGDAVVVDDGSGHPVMQSCQHALELGRYAGENAARDLTGQPVVLFQAPTYVTCLDLGGSGAVFTKGWDRRIEEVGRKAKLRKERINTITIYPPLPSRPRDLLACSPLDPREVFRAGLAHRHRTDQCPRPASTHPR
jgi:NADH:ubiquinone reductase (H+-translocating)